MLFDERNCFTGGEQDLECVKNLQMNSDPTPVQHNYIALPRPSYPKLKLYIEDLLNSRNVMIYSKSFKEHVEHVWQVLRRLGEMV